MFVAISNEQLGSRLADARKRAELTQAAVADRVGLARTTLVAIEKGERRPSDAELIALADVLGVRVHDLLRPHAVRAGVATLRIRAGIAADDAAAIRNAAAHLRERAARYTELERMLDVARSIAPIDALHTYQRASAASLDPRRDGQDAARAVRALLGLGDEPLHDLEDRLDAGAGLRIFHVELPSTVAAILTWSDELGGCIGLNGAHAPTRRRWALAHELGQFLRSRDTADILELDGSHRRDAGFAEAFAEELLMPMTGVQRRFAEIRRLGTFTPVQLHELTVAFGVSFHAMTTRLEELRLLPPATYDGMLRRSARGRPPVAAALAEPIGYPARYVALAVEAYERELVSERELAEILGVDILTARQIRQRFEIAVDDAHYLAPDHAGADLLTAWA